MSRKKFEEISAVFRQDCAGLSSEELEDALFHAANRWEDAQEEFLDAGAWLKVLQDEKAKQLSREHSHVQTDYDS